MGDTLRRRRRPNPVEQARREAWGRKWGPLTGRTIRDAIAGMEGR